MVEMKKGLWCMRYESIAQTEGVIYWTVIQPTIFYKIECWMIKNQHKN